MESIEKFYYHKSGKMLLIYGFYPKVERRERYVERHTQKLCSFSVSTESILPEKRNSSINVEK